MYTSSLEQVATTSSGVAELARRLAAGNPFAAESLRHLAAVADVCHDAAEEQASDLEQEPA